MAGIMKSSKMAALVGAVALLVAGCTININPKSQQSATPTPSPSPSSTPPTPVSPPPTTLAGTPDPPERTLTGGGPFDVDIIDVSHAMDNGGYYFTSPSGRFHCGILSGYDGSPAQAGCIGPTQPLPPRPSWCPKETGWGVGMYVDDTGAVEFDCRGDMPYDPVSETLDYGMGVTAIGFTCAMHENGVYCRDNTTGHGFRIAKMSNSRF